MNSWGYTFSGTEQFNQLGKEESNDFMYINMLPGLKRKIKYSHINNQF